MQIEKFEIEFLDDLKNNDKKSCIKKLDENKSLLQTGLGEKASYETIKHFIDGINNIIVVTTKKFSLFEKIFKHEALARVFRVWKDSDVLVKACKEKNKDACKWLLSMNVKMDSQDEDGMTALMYAVKDNKLDFVVKELITNKDSLDLVDKNGENAVFHALCNPNVNADLFNELLWRGNINVNHVNKNGDTALLYCCKNEIYKPIQFLISRHDINVNIKDDRGKTAVIYLAEKSREEELKKLKNRNCDYSYTSKTGESVLSLVFNNLYAQDSRIWNLKKNLDIFYFLTSTNCNFNIPINENGNTVLSIVFNNMYVPTEYYENMNYEEYIIWNLKRNFDILYFLTGTNCNFNIPLDKDGNTVLSMACNNIYAPSEDYVNSRKYIKNLETNLCIFYFLINTNCSFNIPLDEDGNTLSMILMLVNNTSTLWFLLTSVKNNNIDLSVKNNYGESASSLCVKQNNYTNFYRLKRHSTFDFGYVDPHNNNTMLMLAAMNKPEFIQEIIEFDVNTINETNVVGENALILGVKANQLLSVITLLKHHINVNHQDIQGNTALHYAIEQKNVNMISEIMKYQADANLKNREGKSAFDVAHEIGDKTILNALREPSSVAENKELEKSHEPSTRYEEVVGYLRPYIRNYHTNFVMTEEFENKSKIAIHNIKFLINDAIYHSGAPIKRRICRSYSGHLQYVPQNA